MEENDKKWKKSVDNWLERINHFFTHILFPTLGFIGGVVMAVGGYKSTDGDITDTICGFLGGGYFFVVSCFFFIICNKYYWNYS